MRLLASMVRRQIEFPHLANTEIQAAVTANRGLRNLYTLEVPSDKALEEKVDSAINRQTSEDDTHPSPTDRFRLVNRIASPAQSGPSGPMWDLFADRDAITKEMSQQIESRVKGYG